MASFPNVRWPKWSAIVETWCDLSVPDVEVLDFVLGEQYPSLPWLNRQTGRQYIGASSPQKDTAYHLCVFLPTKPPELTIAYKLYAFCREHEIEEFAIGALRPAFNKFDQELYSWWNGNAKYVLPPKDFRTAFWRSDARAQARNWKALVQEAADTWRAITESWAVIRIPDYMDRDSPEYRLYYQYVRELHEQQERAEYQRLKAKFGDRVTPPDV
jgi:hypothetical protein